MEIYKTATGCDAISEISSLTHLKALKGEWKALELRALRYSQSQTYEYCELVAELALEQGSRVYVITVRDGGLLVGVWMLTLQRDGWLRVLRPASCGANEEYSWPLLNADADELAQRVFQLAITIPADRLYAYNLPKDGSIDRAASRLPLRKNVGEIEGLFVPFGLYTSSAEIDAAISANLRFQLRRDQRRLRKKGSLTIGWCRTIEQTERALDFFTPAKKKWLNKSGLYSPWINHGSVIEFFKRWTSRSDLVTSPVVAAATFDGKPIAVCVCLQSSHAIEFYMAAYEQEFDYYSPGKMLYRWLIGTSIDSGLDADHRILPVPHKKQWPVKSRVYRTHVIFLSWIGSQPSFGEIASLLRRRLRAVLKSL